MSAAASTGSSVASAVGAAVSKGSGGGISPAIALVDDFVARLDSAGVTLSAPRTAAYLAFLQDGVDNGWLDHMLEICTWEGGTLASAAVKLIYREGDSSTLTNSSYTLAGLNTNGGCKMTGTSARWTSINGLSAFPSNTGGLHAWLRETPGTAASAISMVECGFIFFQVSAARRISGSWGASVTNFGTADWRDVPAGMITCERRASNNIVGYVNDAYIGNNTTNVGSTFRDAAIIYANAPMPMDLAALSDGQMTDNQRSAFTAATAVLMRSLERLIVPSAIRTTLITGQSNASSGSFAPRVTSTQPYNNRQAARDDLNQVRDMPGLPSLIEPVNESIASGMANTVSLLRRAATANAADDSFDMAVSNISAGGLSYAFIKKGTSYYNAAVNNVSEFDRLSQLLHGNPSTVNAVVVVHGESDGGTTYAADIAQWQADYEADLLAITGESKTLPMLHSQVSSFGQDSLARSTYAMLQAHEDNPTKTILVCPKYVFTYADGIHLTAASMTLLGDYYGKALYALMNGGSFTPLRPTSLVRSGAVITISFTGRVGSLVLDDTTITDPGNYGFVWSQTGGTARSIASVALINSDTQIQITLDGDPGSPTAQTITYAGPSTASNPTGNDGGPSTGPRGCVRDSDTTEGFTETPLYNWLVHFTKSVTS